MSSKDDFFVSSNLKQNTCWSKLISYDKTNVLDPETELFGQRYFKLSSFEVFEVEFGETSE